MRFKDYVKKYGLFGFGERFIDFETLCDEVNDEDLTFEDIEGDVYEIIIADKPRISFNDIENILEDNFYCTIDNNYSEIINKDFDALDKINKILLEEIIIETLYTIGEPLEFINDDWAYILNAIEQNVTY